MDWTYNGTIFVPPEPNPYEGFIYIIENLTNGKKYIGKKHFWSRIKNKKTGRRKKTESDWRKYYGSSDDLLKDIKKIGVEQFKRTILHLCIYKKQMRCDNCDGRGDVECYECEGDLEVKCHFCNGDECSGYHLVDFCRDVAGLSLLS